MAEDEEAVGLSRIHMYESKCILSVGDKCIFLTIIISAAVMHTIYSTHLRFCVRVLCPVTSVKSCPLVILPVAILTNIISLGLYFHDHP